MKKRQRKNGNKPTTTEKIVLVTAILSLIKTIIELIDKFLE